MSRKRKAKRRGALTRASRRPGVVEESGMHGSALHGNREISCLASRYAGWSVPGRRGAVAGDARTREVRLRHSSDEACEQRRETGRGVGGAKGGDRGKQGRATYAPDA